MPSLLPILLFDQLTPTASTRVSSEIIRPQGVREESVTFWVLMTGTLVAGSLQIRVAPSESARLLTTPRGAILHTVIWAGSSSSPAQTKVNTQGHAIVTVPAFPMMWVDIQGTSGTETVTAYLVE